MSSNFWVCLGCVYGVAVVVCFVLWLLEERDDRAERRAADMARHPSARPMSRDELAAASADALIAAHDAGDPSALFWLEVLLDDAARAAQAGAE